MIKKITLKKLIITCLFLLVAIILCSYPKEINNHIGNNNINKRIIYLIDINDYVAMTKTDYKDLKELIESLIEGKKELPNGFRAVIPANTKLLDFSLENGLLKINFSKEFLEIKKNDEEKMIESLIYSLTSLEGIEKIMIFVEGENLTQLPNSHKKLNLYLDRNYGINKVYDINKITNSTMVTIYFSSADYYVPVSYITNDQDDKINIIIKNMKSNTFTKSNLSSHLNYNIKLMNYEINNDSINLNFDNILLDSVFNGKLEEEVKYTLYYSLHDTIGVKNVIFSINNESIDEFTLEK